MRREGVAELPLHPGRAPRWLVTRMERLSRVILRLMYDEFGSEGILEKLSDPFWFQALSCVLGYDWDSSGTTTVVCAVLKSALEAVDVGVRAVGGKGVKSRRALDEIPSVARLYGFSDEDTARLRYASRLTAKVDNAAVQDGYQIYHHTMLISRDGEWVVVQQGMNEDLGWARRYHWISSKVKSFVVEPHKAIVGDGRHTYTLNMVAAESEGCRKASVELAAEHPSKLRRTVAELTRRAGQKTLYEALGLPEPRLLSGNVKFTLKLNPESVNWSALKEAYESKPSSYEELLAIRGVGPSTVRSLALISQIVYGEPPSWRDPVKFSFAFGGKDGIPFPVRRRVYDEAVRILEEAAEEAKLGRDEKIRAIRKLKRYTGI